MARANYSDSSSSSSSNSSSETTTVQTCLYFCDVEPQNQTTTTSSTTTTTTRTTKGFCPAACLAICPSICHYSLSSLISPPSLSPPQPNNPHNLSPLLISMLIILASVFLLITFYLLYTKLQTHNPQTRPYNNHNNNPLDHDEHGGPTVVFHPIWYIPTVGLNSALINSIPLRKHSASSPYATLDCAVCLADFHHGEDLRVLPKCDHAFHVACIDTWLRSHTNCPLCRAPVVAPPPPPDQTARNNSSSFEVVEQQSAASTTGSTAARDGGDLRIEIIARSASMNCVDDNKASGGGCGGGGGCGIGGGGCCSSSGSSFVSRSMSCSAKIFCSRYNNNRPGPNS